MAAQISATAHPHSAQIPSLRTKCISRLPAVPALTESSTAVVLRSLFGALRYICGMDDKRELLRHTVATLAYRAARVLDDAPDSFATFDACGRQPIQILAHMGDLFDWALSAVEGRERWHNSSPLPWPEEKTRFFASLTAFDDYLASDAPLHAAAEPLFQGPIADALTHVGQLAMMRRLAGSPTRGENFFVAAVAVGQVSADQPRAVQPFR